MTKQLDRSTWRLVVAGYVVLSLAWLIGAGWTYKQEREIHDTLDSVRANQVHIKGNQGRIQRVTSDGAALICALAEGDNAHDKLLMRAYISTHGGVLSLTTGDLPPICREVLRVSRERVGLR